jgi:uncharacterized protein (TIGR00369 family)
MEHYRKLEHLYSVAPVNQWYEPELHIEEGRSELRMELRPDYHHSAGAVHGSVYFKALDDATFFAANSLVEAYFVLTAKFEIEFLRPVSSGELRAIAQVTDKNDKRIFAEGRLYDSDGQLIGRGKGSFAISKIALTPDVGYV